MSHPLTDEMCENIAPWSVQAPCGHTNMRAAADWQLERAIEWLKVYPMRAGRARMIADFKQAMRPQEES